ncbi:MAG: ribbon-helix-helix protein, CopG family [Salinisphaera sp.]|nr:ribbon-helix-helix protein, CopG family [Salinisphaera sp.]MDN5937708.1 ribbon-helix-helix protein, CopG family [Salinisphaera sp.]
MRTIIDLPEQDADRLDRLARQERISRNEAVRRAVRAYLRRPDAAKQTLAQCKDAAISIVT